MGQFSLAQALLRTLVLSLVPSLVIAAIALLFVDLETVFAACALAYAIVLVSELPVHLFLSKQNLPLTLSLRLSAIIARLLMAVLSILLFSAAYTEAFILIFCVNLSLTIMFDATLVVFRSQEPVHA